MGSLTEKLEYLNDTKNEIRKAIISRYVEVPKDTTFREYAAKINEIPVNAEVDTEALNVTENGEYEAGTGRAYSTVTVNVQPNLGTMKFTKNGTYKASDNLVDGYSQVEVDVPVNTKEKVITEDGEYKASDDEVDGYSKVTVDVAKNLKEKKITSEDLPQKLEPVTFTAADEDAKGYSKVTIDVTGTIGDQTFDIDPSKGDVFNYQAADDNLYGYGSISIHIIEDPGPFTVEFWDEGTRLISVPNVEKHQNVDYKTVSNKDYPTREGMDFIGWNPEPIDVTSNLKCYAQFEKKQDNVDEDGNILKDWSQIAANGGADIEIGGKLTIYYGEFDTPDGMHIDGGHLNMMKVASGEGGSTSTWLSLNTLNIDAEHGGYKFYNFTGDHHGEVSGWEGSSLQNFLNGTFYNALASLKGSKYNESAAIVNAIKPVTKYTRIYDPDTSMPESGNLTYIGNAQSKDKIWIPSRYEVTGRKTGSESDNSQENRGKNYSDVYPAPSNIYFRTVDAFAADVVRNAKEGDWNFEWNGEIVAYNLNCTNTVSTYARSKMHAWYDEQYAAAWEENHPNSEYPYKVQTNYVPSICIGFCT